MLDWCLVSFHFLSAILCPQTVHCLSANLGYSLTPFWGDILHGSPSFWNSARKKSCAKIELGIGVGVGENELGTEAFWSLDRVRRPTNEPRLHPNPNSRLQGWSVNLQPHFWSKENIFTLKYTYKASLGLHVQSGRSVCRSGNGDKLSNSQICCLTQLCLAAA